MRRTRTSFRFSLAVLTVAVAVFFDSACVYSSGDVRLGVPEPLDPGSEGYARQEKVATIIDRISESFRLTRLADERLSDGDLHLRLWSTIGSDESVNVLVVDLADNEGSARFLQGQRVTNRSTDFRLSSTSVQSLSVNDADWQAFRERLASHAIGVPLGVIPDPQAGIPSTDEGWLFLELATSSGYDSIAVDGLSRSLTGRKIQNHCEWLKKEFNLPIGCSDLPRVEPH